MSNPDAQSHEDASSVRLLIDQPASADEFEGKAHEKVAKAIAELVSQEPGGSVIGLEGSWGSGKSTVVQILRAILEGATPNGGDPATRVVVFDAWSHQSDPLRRTFLETLVEELRKAHWLADDEAASLKARLTGKASEVHTETSERLSREGALLAFSLTLVPLGVFLADNKFSHHAFPLLRTWHRFGLAMGALLLALPVLIVLVYWFAKRVAGILGGGTHAEGTKLRRLADLQPFSLFAKAQTSEIKTKGVERGEPTSVEFESLFSETLAKALNPRQRLLLVLDNLDRVDEADARKILATMQTFTGSGGRSGADWATQVWTLIPYDPAGLDRLWARTMSVNPLDGELGATAPRESDVAILPTPTAAAFVEKIFQIRFEAPPLVLSDWRGYLHRLLREALPKADEESDLQPLLNLRRLYPGAAPGGLVDAEPPTPRQLKQFVNQIGAIARQRNDVPLTEVGYYVLLRQDRIRVDHALLSGELPHPQLVHLFADDLRDNLAALHYGTPRAIAQQLLLGRGLEEAITHDDAAAIERIKDRSGFAEAVESLDWSSRALNGGVELSRAVALLDAAGVFETPELRNWARYDLHRLVLEQDGWRLDGTQTGVGLSALFCSMASEEQALSALLKRISPSANEGDDDQRRQLEGVVGLGDDLVRRGRFGDGLRVRIALDSANLVTGLEYFGAQAKEKQSKRLIEPTSNPSQVADAFFEAATSDASQSVTTALAVLLARAERINMTSLTTKVLGWLKTEDPATPGQFDVLLDIINRARSAGVGADVIATGADDGTLMHLVSMANRNGWYPQAAAASLLHLTVRPEFPTAVATREAPAGDTLVRQSLANPAVNPEIVNAQSDWLRANRGGQLIFVLASEPAFRPWVEHQIRTLGVSGLSVTAPQFLAHWQLLKASLPPSDFASLIHDGLSHKNWREKVLSDLSSPQIALEALDALAKSPESALSADVRAWGRRIVTAATSADWQSALKDSAGGPLLTLALALADAKEAPRDPPGLSDALHGHFQALAAGEPSWAPTSEVFGKLIGLLGASARQTIASQFCAELEPREGKVEPALFATYGQFLASESAFRQHEKLPNFLERAVANDQWATVDWVAKVAATHPDTLAKPGRDAGIEHLSTRVAEKVQELGAGAPDGLTNLAELLGVKKYEPPETPDASGPNGA